MPSKWILIVLLVLYNPISIAESAMALGYTPKYKADFEHFDYVNPKANHGGKLVLSAFGSFDSLNPFLLKGISAANINTLVFETLMVQSLDEPFTMYGLIAQDIALAQDGLSVTFTLDPEAKFSDGSSIKAEDVAFSFHILTQDEATHPMYKLYWAGVEKAVVLDDQHIRFDFKEKNSELHLILGQLPVFSKKWLGDKSFAEVVQDIPIGSGPYIIKAFEPGRYIRYSYDPNYWAKDKNVRKGMFNFAEIEFKYYKDLTIAFEAFKAQEFDFMVENNSKRWAKEYTGKLFNQGSIIKKALKHKQNTGMQGFIFNLRNPLFQDIQVRKALNLAFDFNWANSNLFYDQYQRCYSYHSNSELASQKLPEGEELALLAPWKEQLPEAVFNTAWQSPFYEDRRAYRKGLKEAKALLEAAGWKIKNRQLTNAKGEVFSFEILVLQQAFKRIIDPYAQDLARLGIEVNYRQVDAALYQQRLQNFAFDMIIMSYPQSESPGNEQFYFFHSSSAEQPGSRNFMGLKNPVVDDLIEKLIKAETRDDLLVVTHALDRVLLNGYYLIPHWYIDSHRIAYWDKFAYPTSLPLYYSAEDWMLMTWWIKP